MATGAKYKVYNGSTWVEYYFPTSADLVIESDTKKFVSPTEKTTWNNKQSALSATQLNAVNSGITSTKVSTYDGYATTIAGKQATLVSGTNIKTINGTSILGSGNLEVVTDVSGKMDKSGGTFTGSISMAYGKSIVFNSPEGSTSGWYSRIRDVDGTLTFESDDGDFDFVDGDTDTAVTFSILGGSDRTIYFPAQGGTLALASDLTGKENTSNKTSSIGNGSDTSYPTTNAVKEFVNSSINAIAAYYITKNANGDPFATKAELTAATTFYSGGTARTPTRNDYCIVSADETQGGNTTRYIYNNGWEFQYTFNYQFTQNQWNAINSEITKNTKVTHASGTAVGGTTTPVYVDANGNVTALTYSLNATVPSNAKFTDTDTKNTAGSTNSNSKLYLVGAASQAANIQTYSNSKAYVTNGELYSNGTKVSVEGHTHDTYLPLTGGTLTDNLYEEKNIYFDVDKQDGIGTAWGCSKIFEYDDDLFITTEGNSFYFAETDDEHNPHDMSYNYLSKFYFENDAKGYGGTKTYYFPNKSGNVALTSDITSMSNKVTVMASTTEKPSPSSPHTGDIWIDISTN